MKQLLKTSLVLLCLIPTPNLYGKVKILTWWSYIHPDTIKSLNKITPDTEIITYKTNDNAIARLSHNREGFDIAIISNVAIKVLRSADPGLFLMEPQLKSRYDYIDWINKDTKCIPYFWSITTFMYDSRSIDFIPNTLQSLIRTQKYGYKIAIVDDPFEFAARYKSDYKIPLSTFHSDLKNIPPSAFVSSIADFKSYNKVAAYEWSGTNPQIFKESSWFKMALPKNKIIVGYDAICSLRSSGKPNNKIKNKVLKILSSKRSLESMTKMVQYYSPIKDHFYGLNEQSKKTLEQLKEREKKEKFILLDKESVKTFHEYKSNWRRLRYGP